MFGNRLLREQNELAKRCDICGKGPQVGRQISHAHNVNRKVWNPNIQKMRVMVNGKPRRAKVCSRCLRSGKVTKVA
jgi:large subunit ribosomal protein L28